MPMLQTPLWFVLSADGYPHQVVTSQAIPSAHPTWEFPVRLVLELQDLSRAYLYVTLSTFKFNSQSTQVLGRSRIGLRSFPIGNPKRFTFPLMHSANSANKAADVTFVATLSQFTPRFPQPVVMAPSQYNSRGYTYPQEVFYGSRL